MNFLSAFNFQLSAKNLLSAFCFLFFSPLVGEAQNIRYVCNNNDAVTYTDGGVEKTAYHVRGAYKNDGCTWATAKENIQDAINDLAANKLTGEVWVASGTYSPTESTESSGGSTLYMSFKIPAGITVRGGFRGELRENADGTGAVVAGEATLADRPMNASTSSSIGESTKYRTILSGSLKGAQDPTFTWNETQGQFDTQFYGNCYHVVTFATNGFDADGRANALVDGGVEAVASTLGREEYVAKLEGVVVQNGNAKNTSLDGHPHNAYGGGVYMVAGAMVENVFLQHCEASRDGGAIYMDGGGIVRHCYIADCQALGVDLTSGYGGGLCADENKQIYPLQITRTTVTNCVARYGGGMASKVSNPALSYGPINGHTYQMKYNNGFSANLITNCTATAEGGGAYSHQGGAWTHMTIVGNRCNGSGVTINGMKTGQSAGLYVRDDAIVGNSLLWGGTTKAANDKAKSAQFAVSRSSNSVALDVRYTALNNVDNTNWSGVRKDHIIKLSNYNTRGDVPTDEQANEIAGIQYPAFLHPSTVVGHETNAAALNYLPYTQGTATPDGYSYKVSYGSAASYAGIISRDLDYEGKTPVKDQTIDIQGQRFGAYPTLGAYVSEHPGMAPSIEYNGTLADGATGHIAHVYVDPNTTYLEDAQYCGSSWNSPIRNLSDALTQIGERTAEVMPAYPIVVSEIQVHVKQGTVDMNGMLVEGSIRSGSLTIPDATYTQTSTGTEVHPTILILGGYDQSLDYDASRGSSDNNTEYRKRHNLSKRNPVLTPTIVTGKVLNDYKYHIPHLMRIENRSHVVVDGLQFRYANARSQALETTSTNGAALTITNSTDISIRNVLVAGCTADNGAAVYATEGSDVELENCIFHNNETTFAPASANVFCDKSSRLTLDHCNILRNVGYAIFAAAGGQVEMTNSMVYANMSQPVANTNAYGVANEGEPDNPNDLSLSALAGGGTYTGGYNLFDLKSRDDAKAQAMKLADGPWLQFSTDGGSHYAYPSFVNPTKNAGVSTDGDATLYGRGVNFQPQGGNPMINAASTGSAVHSSPTSSDCWGTDMSTIINRDYGGLPDIGAIECHLGQPTDEGEYAYTDGQRMYGTLLYVRDYDGDTSIGGDGTSWENAINGNAYYHEASGQFLGSNASGSITWTEVVPTYTTSYGALSTSYQASTVQNPTLYLIYNTTAQKYLKISSTGTFSLVANQADADQFVITASGAIYDNNTGRYVTTSGTSSLTTSTTSVNWTIASGRIYRYLSRANRYLRVASSTATAPSLSNTNSNNTWNFSLVSRTQTGTHEETKTQNVAGINGLQYAVNKSSSKFAEDKVTREVWVAAGTYAKNPETGDKSCFIIRDGVNVYGAFPKVGNPAKEQRQALVSCHVKVHGSYSPTDYETILEPLTKTIGTGASRRVLGQPYDYNPSNASGKDSKNAGTPYSGAAWDGFTIRHGVVDRSQITVPGRWRDGYAGAANGGGGAVIYRNVTLRNCVVTNNTILTPSNADNLGGGVYCAGGTLEQCYVINNQNIGWTGGAKTLSFGQTYGGGLTIEEGTVYNSVFANNLSYGAHADGGGIFIYNATFFNNTIVSNKAEGSQRYSGGIAVWTNATGTQGLLTVYNSISINNEGYKKSPYSDQASCGDENIAIQAGGDITLTNCLTRSIADSYATSTKGYAKITFTAGRSETVADDSDLFVAPGDFDANLANFADCDFRLKAGAAAINRGENAPTIDGVAYNLEEYSDMDYTERVKDCTIDIGAYEYDDAYAIAPTLSDTVATFYVTPGGAGTASATDPANAACAAKLQKVIDAAGRYKYNNPARRVVVKVANSYAMLHPVSGEATNFTYYAGRTTDYSDQDIRVWSIDIPRGVEVWGGYTDVPMMMQDGKVVRDTDAAHAWGNTYNGFYSGTTDLRDILANPTYFDAAYYNKDEKQSSTCYHVVSFTDKVYDGNGRGYPYITSDSKGSYDPGALTQNSAYDPTAGNADITYLSMASRTTDRAVIDGIFIEGGKADIASSATGSTENIHQFGGAAIVTDYAHVRNCIARNNEGKYGGAFALTDGALISGSLVEKNVASYGGAVYVFRDGTKLSDGTIVATGTAASDIERMAHIYTSTIVDNEAQKQGGGIWFTDEYSNVRVNSTVLWQNRCNDESNVYGQYSPEKADDDKTRSEDFFPFSYSAVQNMRLSGTNNLSLETNNANGMRIWKHADNDPSAMATDQSSFADFGFWLPTSYSVLLGTGMPKNDYTALVASKGLAQADFGATDRLVGATRTYVDIGARALEKPLATSHLMLRLFVAKAEDVDMDAASEMMKLDASKVTATGLTDDQKTQIANYYRQEGSSFAYPFQSLQDALDYIVWARRVDMVMTPEAASALKASMVDLSKAVDVPFEIFIAKGEYYPSKDIAGNYGESLANTFALPEGVSLYGGFDCMGLKNSTEAAAAGLSNAFFGGYQTTRSESDIQAGKAEWDGNTLYSLAQNIQAPTDLPTNLLQCGAVQILLQPTDRILASRPREDINKNSIVEPWEFQNQTILDGNTTNQSANGVYHVVSILPDENIVGRLPHIQSEHGKNFYADYVADVNDPLHGYQPYETGQDIWLNGITVSGGYAEDYKAGQMDELSEYIYFKGGGLVADGNRYYRQQTTDNGQQTTDDGQQTTDDGQQTTDNGQQTTDDGQQTTDNGQLRHSELMTGYKHNDVPGNVAYHNIPINIVNCKFRDNVAGYGGAIASNCEMLVYGSSFENNLAHSGSDTFEVDGSGIAVDYPGQGGAISCSYQFSAYNTLFANNEAQNTQLSLHLSPYRTYTNQHPTDRQLGGAGGALFFGRHSAFHLFNCNLVRNKANAYPAIFTANPNYLTQDWMDGSMACMPGEYNQLENSVAWGNEVNAEVSCTEAQRFAASLICNLGRTDRAGADYSPAFDIDIPSRADFEADATEADIMQRKWMETAWFSSYEDGRGLPASNATDMRALATDPSHHIVSQLVLTPEGQAAPYQNCNLIIDAENGTLNGPNFGNPSQTAGVKGYREDSDWSPSRLCNLTDNGSGLLVQTPNATTGEMEFVADGETGVYPGSGTYWTARYQQINDNSCLPIGNDAYMRGTGTGRDILRISLDPNPTHGESYVDIGVYEYVHQKLTPHCEGDEVDILWVSTEEKYANGVPNGSSWEQPTADLQRAIETLLASRNGHRKEIRLMDGEYTPIYTINGHRSFYVDTKYLNTSVTLPDDYDAAHPQGVVSLCIVGGYSRELMNQHNVDLYPSVIRSQARSTATGRQWDHAIYIGDASQRYAITREEGGVRMPDYSADNGYGWWETAEKQSLRPMPQLIPIEIDGITVCNDQALAETAHGAAIYYADQSFDALGQQTDGAADYVASATSTAHVSRVDESGRRLYWTDATRTATTTSPTDYPAYGLKEDAAKLILSKCMVYGSGNAERTNTTSAVYIGRYGGRALVYNSVFHSNYGSPLEAFSATTINNTFALNQGKAMLWNSTGRAAYDEANDDVSSIFNSVFWKNCPLAGEATAATAFDTQFQLDGFSLGDGAYGDITAHADIFSRNAYTGGVTQLADYQKTGSGSIAENNFNVGLVDLNTDAIYGPNFLRPDADDLSQRSFKLGSSLRLLNKGDNALYDDGDDGSSRCGIYEYAWMPTTKVDAAGNVRIQINVIDLGAYEYQSGMNRVLYVDPNRTTSDSGLSWATPLAYGDLQAAIDLAAVYYKNFGNQAYVFVKNGASTNKALHTGESITLRNGVCVYGSVVESFKDDCAFTKDPLTQDYVYDEDELRAYVRELKLYHRGGIVNPHEGHTRVTAIRTNGTEFEHLSPDATDDGVADADKRPSPQAVVDGFEVMPLSEASAVVSQPVVNIRPFRTDGAEADGNISMCVSNIVVHGFDARGKGVDIAQVNNALLYGVLFHSNKVDDDRAVLNLNINADNHALNYGYVVNCTVEGRTVDAQGKYLLNNVSEADGEDHVHGNTAASHIYNSITNYTTDEGTWKTLSGYCYAAFDTNLDYQLTEHSPYVDACDVTNPITLLATTDASRTALQHFVKYQPTVAADRKSYTDGDLDLLGNFRLQTLGNLTAASAGSYEAKMDRGAFETWRVDVQDVVCVYPDYPHDGSVEYIMAGRSLVIDPVAESGDNRGNAHYPGFVLLQDGASLYGNGRSIMAGYVGVERSVAKDGTIVAMPFRMDYTAHGGIIDTAYDADGATNTMLGVGMPSYDANGVLLFDEDAGHTVETYNGRRRSAWDCDFTNTLCWDAIADGTTTEACMGIYYKPETANWSDTDRAAGKRTYRFVGRGTNLTDYIYREAMQQNAKHQKAVVMLTQHDDRETTDGAADITSQEDMGWNCIGIPYLVSNYEPYTKVGPTADGDIRMLSAADSGYDVAPYAMDIPHRLWLYYDGRVDADGQKMTPNDEQIDNGEYYPVDSWMGETNNWHVADTETPRLWVGEGFFTQTAAVKETEPLTFYRPVYDCSGLHGAPRRANSRCYVNAEAEDSKPKDLSQSTSDIAIGVKGCRITVSGLRGGELIEVYLADGRLIHREKATGTTCTFSLPQMGVYIVTVGHRVSKKVRCGG